MNPSVWTRLRRSSFAWDSRNVLRTDCFDDLLEYDESVSTRSEFHDNIHKSTITEKDEQNRKYCPQCLSIHYWWMFRFACWRQIVIIAIYSRHTLSDEACVFDNVQKLLFSSLKLESFWQDELWFTEHFNQVISMTKWPTAFTRKCLGPKSVAFISLWGRCNGWQYVFSSIVIE